MTWPCLLAWVPSAMCRSRPETRSRTSTQSPPAQMFSWPRTRIARSVSSPPCAPSGRPAARASVVSGRTPMPSTTTSAGYSASSVATARDPAVRAGEHLGDLGVVDHGDAQALHRLVHQAAHVRVERGHRLAAPVDDRHLVAAVDERLGHLHADVARADDHGPCGPASRASVSISAWPSSRVCTPCTPGASTPGRSGRIGRAPVAIDELVVRRPGLGPGIEVTRAYPPSGDVDLGDLGAHPQIDVARPVLLGRAGDQLVPVRRRRRPPSTGCRTPSRT